MSDLTVLFPEPQVVRLGKKRVLLLPVELRHFELFAKVAKRALGLLKFAPDKLFDLASSSADVHRLLADCTTLTAWRIKRLPAAVIVQLLLAIIEANASFFVQALEARKSQLTGATPSKD